MKRWLATLPLFLAPAVSIAERVNFDGDPVGAAPVHWMCGVTGRGQPHWVIADDTKALSPPHLLIQRGRGDFPWCVKQGTALTDGYVEVKFRPMAGKEDQAGGVVWRWKDANRYYVARANALENNVSLYYTEGGKRKTLKYVDAPVKSDRWHTLRAEFSGSRINVLLDGKRYIDFDDDHISGAGAVGVWTKADSVTAFDDFFFRCRRKLKGTGHEMDHSRTPQDRPPRMPWLIARFIDKEPEFLYVPADQVKIIAAETGAIPYDVPDVEYTHDGEYCSFDAFLRKHGLDDPALRKLAVIVRGADTDRLDLAPQAAGLLALSLGLNKIKDDHALLAQGMALYDALYAWCQEFSLEKH